MSEDLDRDDWSFEQTFELWRDNLQEDLHTAMPGRVETYDARAQVADVTPLIRRTLCRNDGTAVRSQFPTIRAVPIAWPRAGDWFVHMPLSQGDTVLLVFCERDPTRWRATGELSDAPDVRLHHVAHAIAIPGVYPRTRQISDTPGDALVIGRDGGATIRILASGEVHVAGADPLAHADNLDAHLRAIAGDLTRLKALLDTISLVFTPAYGSDAMGKPALDASNPVPTTRTRGS